MNATVRSLVALTVFVTVALLVVPAEPFYPDKARLLVWIDDHGREQQVRSKEDWAKRRAHILANMQEAMGRLPDRAKKPPLAVQYGEEHRGNGWVRKRVSFQVAMGEKVPGYLFLPDRGGPAAKPQPAVLCLHQTNGAIGSKGPAGLGDKPNLYYALHLAERGYVTLAIDYPSFGAYPFDFAKSEFQSGSMKAVWNNMIALDFLETLPEVNSKGIGCIGHSLGGHNAMFTAAFDDRIAATVSNCGFTSFPKYYGGRIKGWASDRYMPRLATMFKLDPAKVPFDFSEIVAAFAPRAFLASSPLKDDNFEVSGVKDCIAAALPVYGLLGAKERLAANYPDCGHDFPPEVRRVAYEFLDRWLK